MLSRSFDAQQENHTHQVRICLYPNQRALRRAAERFHRGDVDHSVSEACVQRYDCDDGDVILFLRIHQEELSLRVLAHEAHHVATCLYGLSQKPNARLQAHAHQANEEAAYLFNDILDAVIHSVTGWGFSIEHRP